MFNATEKKEIVLVCNRCKIAHESPSHINNDWSCVSCEFIYDIDKCRDNIFNEVML